MSFIWPSMLISLVLVPVLALLYLRALRRRQQIARQFPGFYNRPGETAPAPGTGPRTSGGDARRHLPPALFLLGITILLISLARPQAVVRLPRMEGTIILAFDVSGSMAADDFQPTRMEAAKAAARDFVSRQPPSVQVGVVAFSDNGFSVQPPTNEQETILAAIQRLAPQRGTSLAHGINASLTAIELDAAGLVPQMEDEPPSLSLVTPGPSPTPTRLPPGVYTSAVIVLLSDGENNAFPDPYEAVMAAADRGVRVHTVGIGSTAGSLLKVEGFTVRTRLDETLLRQIAELTGGQYFNAENEQDLQEIYENLDPQFVVKPEMMEITAIFAGASILVLLLGGALSLFWYSRLP